MSHMVIFHSSDGKTGYHQAELLEEAVHFVERIRNAEGVEQAEIFRLEQVRFEFRPYFHVKMADGAPAQPAAAERDDADRPETLTDALPDELEMTPVPEGDGASRRGIFGR